MKKILIIILGLTSLTTFAANDQVFYVCKQESSRLKIDKVTSKGAEYILSIKSQKSIKPQQEKCYRLANSLNLLLLEKFKENEKPIFQCEVEYLTYDGAVAVYLSVVINNRDGIRSSLKRILLNINSYTNNGVVTTGRAKEENECIKYADSLNEKF